MTGNFKFFSEVRVCSSEDFDLRKQKRHECHRVRVDPVWFQSTDNQTARIKPEASSTDRERERERAEREMCVYLCWRTLMLDDVFLSHGID